MPLHLPLISPDGSTYTYLTPASGFVASLADSVTALVINPAGLLATGTINLPSKPRDGQEVNISSTQVITLLGINPAAGHAVSGTVATLALGGRVRFKFVSAASIWFRVG